jgi:hypothetical protein
MDQYIRAMPRWATIAAVCVSGFAMVLRNAWPNPMEIVAFVTAVVCIYGALRSNLAKTRMLFAGLWVAMVVTIGYRLEPPQVWLDFSTFVNGARLLFADHQSPYLAEGTTAFPFPIFPIVRALSFGGHLTSNATAWLFFVLELLALALSYMLVRGTICRERLRSSQDWAIALIQGGLMLHPALLLGLYYGQSAVLASASVIGAVWCWRCANNGWWRHGAAILLNLAWMIKPQLLMAAGFFIISWIREPKVISTPHRRDAAIGRLILPWSAALIAVSILLAFPAFLTAYSDFFTVAFKWHTFVAENSPNNYAISAILAKAGMRFSGISASQTLPFLSTACAGFVLLWNCLSMHRTKPDSLLAFIPWLLASLLWTPLVWRFYLSLVIAGLLLLVAYEGGLGASEFELRTLWLSSGIGLTLVLSSFAFTLGILLLYFLSQRMLVEESAISLMDRDRREHILDAF